MVVCAVYDGMSILAEIEVMEQHIHLLTAVMVIVVLKAAVAVAVTVAG